MAKLETINDRVWFAWHCLPRGKSGKPPAWRALEREHGISGATFSTICDGSRKSLDAVTAASVADALGVDLDWLVKDGSGLPAPRLTGPFREREDQYSEFDPATWVKKAEAVGGVDAFVAPRNHFEAAAADLAPYVRVETIERVKAIAAGQEDERPQRYWGHLIITEERKQKDADEASKRETKAAASRRKSEREAKRTTSEPPRRKRA